ncbi:MAG: SCO family protein [Acetobacteraceae bacterium]|nr:SCO family protein [Acetobacteraceae bacterium]MDW8398069.1 SCO family protein [Acetobacteraceae bacterium]
MLRLIRFTALLLMVPFVLLWAVAWFGRQPGEPVIEALMRHAGTLTGAAPAPPSAGVLALPEGVSLGGPFRLTDHTGRAVTEADFAGGFSLVYFGFTYCPDVCPTELGTMAAALDLLGEAASRITPILVTIDPARDTPAQLADYVSRFHPRLVGLTGSESEVAEIARRFRVFYARVHPPDSTEYLMDHSSFIYLVGPDFRARAIFRPNTDPEAMAAAIRARLPRG